MSLRLLMSEIADIKRATISLGKRGAPETVLTGLACTPLYPADPGAVNGLLMQPQSETPYRLLEAFVTGHPSIKGGDLLVMAGESYTVRAVAKWTMPLASRKFTHLLVEERPDA